MTKTCKVQIRTEKEEYQRLQAEAKRLGISMSKLIREYINNLPRV